MVDGRGDGGGGGGRGRGCLWIWIWMWIWMWMVRGLDKDARYGTVPDNLSIESLAMDDG